MANATEPAITRTDHGVRMHHAVTDWDCNGDPCDSISYQARMVQFQARGRSGRSYESWSVLPADAFTEETIKMSERSAIESLRRMLAQDAQGP